MIRSDHPYHRNRKRFETRKALTQDIARPTMTGLRQVWNPTVVADGLTPQRLAAILKSAESGNHHQQLELAEAMEERDLHYGGVLQTRRLAIQGLEPSVESHSDDPHDLELADAVRDLVRRPAFDDLIDDLTDALGKGYAADVIDWEPGELWQPSYRWIDPRWFLWDQEDGRTLRLVDEADPTHGIDLQPNRWIVHVPRLKSGIPARSGLARLAAIAYMCKSWVLKDWMAFADTYGLPLRVGKYGAGASEDDIGKLVTAVANIASDAGAVIPQSMEIEFVEAVRGISGGNVMFEDLANYLDAQISKRILGHTGSSDSTPGKLGGETQASEVRLDILKSDAKQLAATINRDLIKPFIDLNFGVQDNYPLLCLPVPEPEDTQLIVNACKDLVPLGLKVEQSEVRDKLGLRDPELDANGNPVNDLLQDAPAPAAPAWPATADPGTGEDAPTAHNRQAPGGDELDGLIGQLAGSADQVFDKWAGTLLGVIDEAIDEGLSLDQLQSRLLERYGQLDAGELAAVMGQALATAELAGRAEIEDGG